MIVRKHFVGFHFHHITSNNHYHYHYHKQVQDAISASSLSRTSGVESMTQGQVQPPFQSKGETRAST